jgi:hypothetical protein
MAKLGKHTKEDRKRAALHLVGQSEDIALWQVGVGNMATWQGVSRSYAHEILEELVSEKMLISVSRLYRKATENSDAIHAKSYLLSNRARDLYEDKKFITSYNIIIKGKTS